MKVFYYCNFPSPYYIGFLNELGKLCELTAVFERGYSSERDPSWKEFSAPSIKNLVILHGIHTKADMAFCPQITRYLRKEKYDAYILHDPASPTGMWLIWYMKLHKIPFILQSEGGFPGDGKTGIKEKYKRALMSGAQLYLSTMSIEREYFLAYGAEPEKVIRYPFASFYQTDILTKPKTYEEKMKLKKELFIKEKKVIISVGRIIPSKAYDILIEAVKDSDKNVGIYIISGPATPELQSLLDKYKLTNVHFVDFMPKDRLWKYYQMADFLALPTRSDTWGLFVNEAMANGLPVITTKMCVAGLELIEDGVNGYLIDVDDVEDLKCKIRLLIEDNGLCQIMAHNNIEKIHWYSFEEQAKVTNDALVSLLKYSSSSKDALGEK